LQRLNLWRERGADSSARYGRTTTIPTFKMLFEFDNGAPPCQRFTLRLKWRTVDRHDSMRFVLARLRRNSRE